MTSRLRTTRLYFFRAFPGIFDSFHSDLLPFRHRLIAYIPCVPGVDVVRYVVKPDLEENQLRPKPCINLQKVYHSYPALSTPGQQVPRYKQ